MRTALKRIIVTGSVAALVATLSACTPSAPNSSTASSSGVSAADTKKALNTPTTITFWTWVNGIDEQVKLFEQKYPKITVKVVNAGQGAAQYTKLRTALKANKGLPDVAQIEYQYLSSFRLTKSLADLTPYGASALKSKYVDWVWNQVSDDTGVWAIPQDSGPMGTLYQADVLEKAGIDTPPTTWQQYEQDAATLKQKTGNYISDMPGSDPGQLIGLFWQNGAQPFTFDGKKTVSVDLDSAKTQQVVDFWQRLIQKGYVDTAPDFTNDWYKALDTGKYATWQTAAWAATFLPGAVKSSAGKWRAAPLPQWGSTEAAGNWGGSSDAVMQSSTHKIAAAALAQYLNSNPTSTTQLATKRFLFPVTKSVLDEPTFVDQKPEFYGGQQVNKVFAGVSDSVNKDFQWLPITDYLFSSYTDTLGKAIANKGDMRAGLSAWQKAVITYAKQQGFTVK